MRDPMHGYASSTFCVNNHVPVVIRKFPVMIPYLRTAEHRNTVRLEKFSYLKMVSVELFAVAGGSPIF